MSHFDGMAQTLRELIEVRKPDPESLLSRADLWSRCTLLPPGYSTSPRRQIFVDGFAKCCHWNSWRVYSDAIESGLSIWLGFAFLGGRWTEHNWCMLNQRIVETTLGFYMYFGAELNADERDLLKRRYESWDPLQSGYQHVCTIRNGCRTVVPYDPNVFAGTIGREREWKTGYVIEGLGRQPAISLK